MSELAIYKASSHWDGHKTESAKIVIEDEFPHDLKGLDQVDLVASTDANRLEQVLNDTLPGATYDRLFAAMCLRKASHLRVTG